MSLERRLRALESILSPVIDVDGYCATCGNRSMTLLSDLPIPEPCRRCGKLAHSITYHIRWGQCFTDYPEALKGRCKILLAFPDNGRNPNLADLHGTTSSWLK